MWRFLSSNDVPQLLETLDLPGIAKYLKSESCKNVFVMAGAGISTSAGIPDFRSPDTGLYANLARLNLPYPEAVFDISFFKRNPRPFYVLAHELAPGRFRPTLTHSFIRLLAEKGLLHTCFTQNIDTLERAAGVPPHKIIEAHGSFANQHCIKCGLFYPHDKIKKKIDEQEIPVCEKRGCGGYVKPDIVFFGESLPDEFVHGVRHLRDADLLIVMGTSLTVHPFASLTEMVPEECPRLLLNLDHVGGWGSRANDVACLMPCDKAVRELCKILGWEEELDALWAETDSSPKKKELHAADGDMGETKAEKDLQGRKAEDTGVEENLVEPTEPTEKESREGEESRLASDDGKKVSEELLADIIDKLAETINEVRLEDELPSQPEGKRTKQRDLEGSKASDENAPKPASHNASDEQGVLDKDKHDTYSQATEAKQSESESSERTSDNDNSTTTGKL